MCLATLDLSLMRRVSSKSILLNDEVRFIKYTNKDRNRQRDY